MGNWDLFLCGNIYIYIFQISHFSLISSSSSILHLYRLSYSLLLLFSLALLLSLLPPVSLVVPHFTMDQLREQEVWLIPVTLNHKTMKILVNPSLLLLHSQNTKLKKLRQKGEQLKETK